MTKKKLLAMILTGVMTLAVCFAFAGCGGDSGSGDGDGSGDAKASEAADGNTLVYGSGDYTAINPALFEHGEINLLLFAGLTSHDEKDQVVPGLAEKWDFDEETNTYHFTLREGLTFHDGKPLTSEDVKFTIEAIQNPEYASENASNFEDVKEVKAVDDTHVDIVLNAPNEAMPDYLSIGVLPKHLLEGEDMTKSDFNRNPVGAGPYKLVSWDMGQSIVMEKFDEYYQGAPKIDQVIFRIVEDYDARALQLESGELNFAQITPKAEEKFSGKEGFAVYDMTTADYRGIMYNFNNPLFKEHRELPAALSYAIDREAIIKSVLLGKGQTAYSPLQKNEYNEENVEHYDFAPEKTTAALEENGWVKGSDGIYEKDGQKLEFEINCMQGDQVRIDMANLCAQYLGEAGAKVTVETPAEIDWENQAAFLIGWGSPFDADDHTYKVFGTDQAANYSAYSNEKVDAALKAARETPDKKKRKALYSDFQKALADDPAYTFIAYVNAIYAGSDKIHGVTEDTILGHHGVGIFWNIHEWTMDR